MKRANERLAGLSDAQRALLAARRQRAAAPASTGSLPRRPDPGSAPLSFGQQRLWLINQLDPGSVVYNVLRALRLTGPLDVAALQGSLTEIVRRHEVLRTTLQTVDGQPVGQIQPATQLPLALVDLRQESVPEREAHAERLARAEAHRPFDLARGPLFRSLLLRLADEQHVLLLLLHHVVTDGWSTGVLVRELAALYDACAAGRPSPLPELPIQYADYARWQGDYLQGEILQKQLAYWKTQLGGQRPVLDLPTDRPRPPVQTYRGACRSLTLPMPLCEALKALSRREGVTLFMTLLAALKVLLYRYTGQEEILVGSPISGRTRVETEGLIGFFVNTLVLRTDLSGAPTFRELLRRVRTVALGAYAHQDLPYEKLVEVLQPTRDPSRTPFFQVLFQLRNFVQPDAEGRRLQMHPFEYDTGIVSTDLDLAIVEQASGLACRFAYNTDLFDSTTIDRLLGHFQILLEGIVVDPEQRVSDLPLLTPGERQQLLVRWNETSAPEPEELCIHQLFEAQVERTPDAIAVVGGTQQLTYRELNRRANQLAHQLRQLGVGPEVLVGLCLERSPEMLVALLGILKAGGAYLPLDPAYPKERLAYILEDAQAPVLVTHERLLGALPAQGAKRVCLDTEPPILALESTKNPLSETRPDNMAYVLYTSGSTGKPKGVLIPHHALVNHSVAVGQRYGIRARDRVLQFASLSFDVAAEELFPSWLHGATVVLRPDALPASSSGLHRLIESERLTVLNLPASYWHEWVRELELSPEPLPTSLRLVVVGSEKVLPERFRLWSLRAGNRLRWCNAYGPTEATITTTIYEPPAEHTVPEGGSLPIGRPIVNTQLYILDAHQQPVPVGVPGELYIGGRGLARGYHQRPELTAEKFIPNPFSPESGARLYRTGDRVRYLADGNLEILGRVDDQVKIRGFRIELGEIEAVLRQHPAVRETVVVTCADTSGDQRLLAYVVPHSGPTAGTEELRDFLKERLPLYMVPAAFVSLAALPLTPNGKVDRRSLPAPEPAHHERASSFVPPRDPVEVELARLWEDLLPVRPIGVHDDFFALGGHSLLAARLFAQIQKAFGTNLPLATLFQRPTIAHLARILQRPEEAPTQSLVALHPIGSRPPFFCVHGIGGEVLCYAELARVLGFDQPFYGLQAPRWDPSQGAFPAIEALAAQYLQQIRTVQPKGPYRLGGYSSGGTVAFEMAQQLHARGERVALLVMLDHGPLVGCSARAPWTPQLALRFVQNLVYWCADDLFASGLGSLWARLRLKARALSRRWGISGRQPDVRWERSDLEGLFDLDSLPEQYRSFLTGHAQALQAYVPRMYPGRVTVIRARTRPVLRLRSPDLGWGPLAAGGVEVRVIPGAHDMILKEPHVRVLAAQLQDCLRRAAVLESVPEDEQVDAAARWVLQEEAPELSAAAEQSVDGHGGRWHSWPGTDRSASRSRA